ncbi:hypothetical protein J3Q64DRAFT_1825595 [Phycomyces blakesleeanus]|uniref:Actin-like ATPase domain-containing protein n=2 Tax=Phycomyces blakesleeanus TaxID=4837 RepID=A0A167LZL0_PHYB8|nr:hypothetical protein PHYBLDRAFT_147913 [Phycomyces blakesleeanus NRRL 1555(-)]OAD71419.1 hypothetical protein PHYBLDRAFT_147913 [Phycomyces blakesleeanus NRRL 1555(-)]|eukprot:XP_018289459.1 hypothetical protein PHYBLDRAFT_147913 [Phycomyces blakesleeanus NRRL 1555(-)]
MESTLKVYSIIVGIDFGTTFSGYQIASLKDDEAEEYEYPIEDDEPWIYKEAPSTMFYKKEYKELLQYGEDANDEVRLNPDSGYYVTRVKLWLDRTIKDHLPLPHNLTPVEVIGDYLREMYKDICKNVPKEYPACIDSSEYRYCMTVPTIWSEESKGIMREAAILAGIITKYDEPGRLLIVDEAVAAALHAEYESPELVLENGDCYMICDAGGGTVDIAVFERDNSSGVNGLKELTMGTGSSCGSSFVDAQFETMLREKVSKYPGINDWDIYITTYTFKEGLKELFGGDDNENIVEALDEINRELITNHPEIDEELFTLDDIRKTFEPVVDEVLHVIEKQFSQLGDREVDVMFITGGFGQSPYLQERIQNTFDDRVKTFKVIEESYLAVMKGAALFGQHPRKVTQRILRRTYGIKICSPIDETENDTNTKSSKNRFYMCIRKGDPVKEDTWVTRKIIWKKNVVPIISMYAYDGDEPIPEYPTAKEIDLVAIFDTKFPIDDRKEVNYEILVMRMRFGLDKIDIKVNIAGRDFEYVTVWDVTGEKTTQLYSEPFPPPNVKVRKFWLLDTIVKHLP